jgi:hypothetical protein
MERVDIHVALQVCEIVIESATIVATAWVMKLFVTAMIPGFQSPHPGMGVRSEISVYVSDKDIELTGAANPNGEHPDPEDSVITKVCAEPTSSSRRRTGLQAFRIWAPKMSFQEAL